MLRTSPYFAYNCALKVALRANIVKKVSNNCILVPLFLYPQVINNNIKSLTFDYCSCEESVCLVSTEKW